MRGEIRRGPWPTCGSYSRPLVCPTRHDHGDREQSPGTRRTVPQADTCTATRHDLVRATSSAPGPHRPPSSARSPAVRPRRPLIQPAMRTVYSPHYLPTTCWLAGTSSNIQDGASTADRPIQAKGSRDRCKHLPDDFAVLLPDRSGTAPSVQDVLVGLHEHEYTVRKRITANPSLWRARSQGRDADSSLTWTWFPDGRPYSNCTLQAQRHQYAKLRQSRLQARGVCSLIGEAHENCSHTDIGFPFCCRAQCSGRMSDRRQGRIERGIARTEDTKVDLSKRCWHAAICGRQLTRPC